MQAVNREDEIDQLSVLISAAENWSSTYSKDPKSHAKIIRVEAKFARLFRAHFKDLAKDRVNKYIDWVEYHSQSIKAFDVKVIFDEDGFEADETSYVMTTTHDTMLNGIATGAQAGQKIYKRDIGMTESHEAVLKSARDESARLVKDITPVTRDRIQESLQTSLSLGENHEDASARLADILNDPNRAEMIARTEAVNSYNKGLSTFGHESGAKGKIWQDVGADDECADNSAEGEIDIDDTFPSGDDEPTAHPNCRCGMQLTYPTGSEEADSEE